MKILVVTPYFWPKLGGLERYAYEISKRLVASGHEVQVATSGSSRSDSEIDGIVVHSLRTAMTVSNTPCNLAWFWQLRRLIKRFQPDIINVHAPVPSLALVAAAVAGHVPVVTTYHAGSMKKGRSLPDSVIAIYERWALPWLMRRSRAVIPASSSVAAFLKHWSHKASVITPAVDTALFAPNKHQASSNRVLFVGDFRDARKGLGYLIEAIRLLPEAELRVVGAGQPDAAPRTTYLGELHGAELVAEIQAASILALPSITEAESFGMALIEAMACGVPVIATTAGGAKDVVRDGETGLLVAPADSTALESAIRRLLLDEKLRRRMGEAGRKEVLGSYCWDSRVESTIEILDTAVRCPLRVLIMHNVVSFYRLPVFEEICQEVDVQVLFCKSKTSDRKWAVSLDGYSFKRRVLPEFSLGPFFINPTLLWHLFRHRYDVYLVGDFPETVLATFVTIGVAKLRRKRVVLWSETTRGEVIYFQSLARSSRKSDYYIRSVLSTAMKVYRKSLYSMVDRYVAFGSMAEAFLIEAGIAPSKIHSGIQVMPGQFLPEPVIAKRDSPYANKRVALYVGYLNATKGVDILLAAFKRVGGADSRLIIVGTGPELGALKALAADDWRIVFVGYADGTTKADYFNWADVFVLPTLADCWALVVNEALHYGLPVITTSAAGASELVRNEPTGVIVPPADELALCIALRNVLEDQPIGKMLRTRTLGAATDITSSAVGASPILGAIMAAAGPSL